MLPVLLGSNACMFVCFSCLRVRQVKLEVYTHYLRSIGAAMTCLTLLLYVVYQGFSMSSNIWLSIWSSAANNSEPAVRDLYLGVYGALGFGQGTPHHNIHQKQNKLVSDWVPSHQSKVGLKWATV